MRWAGLSHSKGASHSCWLAFNAPHDGLHKPPNELISEESQALDPQGVSPANVDAYFRAMIEALDHEIGRLLANIDDEELDNTYIVFLGDNGTSDNVISAPFKRERGKYSLYQGGINVPLIIAGPGVPGSGIITDPTNVVGWVLILKPLKDNTGLMAFQTLGC